MKLKTMSPSNSLKLAQGQSTQKTSYTVMDLFAGCGGMTLGFLWDQLFYSRESNPVCRPTAPVSPSPFASVWANDFDAGAIRTYRRNFDPLGDHSVGGPIEQVLGSREFDLPQADVVIGGPPCQGFSLLNKNRIGDDRRELWWHFMEAAERAEARVLVMENVPQLLGGLEFVRIKRKLKSLGYDHLMAHVLSSANYGVPQTRDRAIIMASRCGPISLPRPTHLRPALLKGPRAVIGGTHNYRPWRTVREAFIGLPDPTGTELRRGVSETLRLHFGRQPTATSRERYKAVPAGGNRFDLQRNRPDLTPDCWVRKTSGGTDLFGRLWWDRPSVTIRTEFFKPEKGRYLHPDANRPITHREAARLQSFPDRFVFAGSKIEIARQIGNAVPPLLAYAIAQKVSECLRGDTTTDEMEETAVILSELGQPVKESWIAPSIPA